jgi:Fic family protein
MIMVSIVTKNIRGNEYLYLVDSVRKGSKVIQKTIKYIGKKRPIRKEELECMRMSYKDEDWILTDFKDELSYQDHEEMKKLSQIYKEHLKNLDEISKDEEKKRFLSIFISNSNEIEGSTLTPKDTFNYLFSDITPKGHSKKEIYMAENMLKAWEYMESHALKIPNKKNLFELHKLVNKNIETERTLGKYKIAQNYIGDVYTTSYLFTEEKTKKMLIWVKKAFKEMNDFEVAFQSHAQFEIIHPFIDGNGRVGRLLLNWYLINKGISPLAISAKKRANYISALNSSRKGKKEAISKFLYQEYKAQYKKMFV